ncbi:MAG: hypothetical protein IPM93_17120 [Candidatus Obscuribacter sp.]|nr:hypothetical protein [Candidatus Obscuribacter sp.]
MTKTKDKPILVFMIPAFNKHGNLPTGVGQALDPDLLKPLDTRKAKYFGDILVYMPEYGGLPYLEYFQRDIDDNPKGIIKIDLRKPL